MIIDKKLLDYYRANSDYNNPFVDKKGIILDKPWNYEGLSKNSNITWEIVLANPDKSWDYGMLSANPSITWEIIRDNPDIPWDYNWLSNNPNTTLDIVRDNPDKPWDYYGLSKNKFTLDDNKIRNFMDGQVMPYKDELNTILPQFLIDDLVGFMINMLDYRVLL